ncbi:MAG: low molecular weight phosphotyrosine protein phosphatase [Burkholderiales bacterium]|nr:low molecular weight phosphotyrosine protein phosphatase [Burkholderiales bacterium]
MVCMGNICRSPMAEGVLRAKLRAAGLAGRIAVDSAGTIDHHAGEPPDPRAIRVAARRGYDIAAQRARAVDAADFSTFQRLLAMDDDNLAWLRKRSPVGAPARIELMLSHARPRTDTLEVPDPYYGGEAGFERVLDLLEAASDGLVLSLRAELSARGAR